MMRNGSGRVASEADYIAGLEYGFSVLSGGRTPDADGAELVRGVSFAAGVTDATLRFDLVTS